LVSIVRLAGVCVCVSLQLERHSGGWDPPRAYRFLFGRFSTRQNSPPYLSHAATPPWIARPGAAPGAQDSNPTPPPSNPHHALQARRLPRLRKSPTETRPWLQLIVLHHAPPRPPAAPRARRRQPRPGPLLNLAGLHPGARPVDCTSSSPSGEVAATMLAACGHHCCRSGHGDGDASANPSIDGAAAIVVQRCYKGWSGLLPTA
jgi:hypothetical protein